jgi:peptidoglycan lytic transglycosylase
MTKRDSLTLATAWFLLFGLSCISSVDAADSRFESRSLAAKRRSDSRARMCRPKHAAPRAAGRGAELPKRVSYGVASWYECDHQGPLTANGERFDDRALTAAHPRLPLGSRVRVTNLSNGRSVLVRINDRGPFAPGRVIDLTKGAAQRLGFIHQGLAHVRVAVVSLPSGPTS